MSNEKEPRVWSFLQCEYDESTSRLWVAGRHVKLTAPTLRMLEKLLRAEGELVSIDKLAHIWGRDGDTSSSRKALQLLRRAVAPDASDDFIVTERNKGCRIVCGLTWRLCLLRGQMPDLREGAPVPGVAGWFLVKPLDRVSTNSLHLVWEANYSGGGETKVFKFAFDPRRRRSLRREVKAWETIKEYASEQSGFVRIDNSRTTTLPYFLEMEHGGINLQDWVHQMQAQGGLTRETAIALMVRLCEIIAEAHFATVQHNDLKPSNVLITRAPSGTSGIGSAGGGTNAMRWQMRVADFGLSKVFDPERLRALNLSIEATCQSALDTLAGTANYVAPEVLHGKPPTPESDVYALGVILFQILAGDFRGGIPTDWKNSIDDPLLLEDIELATRPDPAQRIQSATALANRLRSLDSRRALLADQQRKAAQERQAVEQEELRRQKEDRRRALRPWRWAAMLAVASFLIGTTLLSVRLNQQYRLAARENNFWTDDLIHQVDPTQGNDAGLTLVASIRQAAPFIDSEFHDDPKAAAHLHETVARALDNGSDLAEAAVQYDLAAKAWTDGEGQSSIHAIESRLELVLMLARSEQPESLDQARNLLMEQKKLIERRRLTPELQFFRDEAEGVVQLIAGDGIAAERSLQVALDLHGKPGVTTDMDLTARDRFCAVEQALGKLAAAETCNREMAAEIVRLDGTDSGNLFASQIRIAGLEFLEGKFQAAIDDVNSVYPRFVRHLGQGALNTLQLLGTRAAAEASLGQWAAAIRDDKSVAATAFERDGSSVMGLKSLSDAALMECRFGESGDGEADARSAVEIVQRPGTNPGLAGAARLALASCLVFKNHRGPADATSLGEADRLLDQIDVRALATVTSTPTAGANIILLRAQIGADRGGLVDARRLLEQAKPNFGPASDPFQLEQIRKLEDRLKGSY